MALTSIPDPPPSITDGDHIDNDPSHCIADLELIKSAVVKLKQIQSQCTELEFRCAMERLGIVPISSIPPSEVTGKYQKWDQKAIDTLVGLRKQGWTWSNVALAFPLRTQDSIIAKMKELESGGHIFDKTRSLNTERDKKGSAEKAELDPGKEDDDDEEPDDDASTTLVHPPKPLNRHLPPH